MSSQRPVIRAQRFENLVFEVSGTDRQGDTITDDQLEQFVENLRHGHCLLTIDHSRTKAPIGRFTDGQVERDSEGALLLANGVLFGTENYQPLITVLASQQRISWPDEGSANDVEDSHGHVLVRISSTRRSIAVAAADSIRLSGVDIEVGRELKKGILDVDSLTIFIGASAILAPFAHGMVKGFFGKLGEYAGARLADVTVKVAKSLRGFLQRLCDVQHVTDKGQAANHTNIEVVFRTVIGPCQIDAVIPSGTPSSQIPDALARMATRLLPDPRFILQPDLRPRGRRLVFTWDVSARGWVPAYLILAGLEQTDPVYDLVATNHVPVSEHLGKPPIGPDGIPLLSIEAVAFETAGKDAQFEFIAR